MKSNEFFGCIAERCIELIQPIRVVYVTWIYDLGAWFYRESLSDILLLIKSNNGHIQINAFSLSQSSDMSHVCIKKKDWDDDTLHPYYSKAVLDHGRAQITISPFVPNEEEAELMSVVERDVAALNR
jgi:hypothetical protein